MPVARQTLVSHQTWHQLHRSLPCRPEIPDWMASSETPFGHQSSDHNPKANLVSILATYTFFISFWSKQTIPNLIPMAAHNLSRHHRMIFQEFLLKICLQGCLGDLKIREFAPCIELFTVNTECTSDTPPPASLSLPTYSLSKNWIKHLKIKNKFAIIPSHFHICKLNV